MRTFVFPSGRSRSVDPSAAVLWLLAVSTAVAAALWAGSDFTFEARYTRSTCDADEVPPRAAPGPQACRGPTPDNSGTLHARQSRPFAPIAGQEVQHALNLQTIGATTLATAQSFHADVCSEGFTCTGTTDGVITWRERRGRPLGWRCRW